MQKLNVREKNNALNEIRILASIKDPYVIGYKESFFDEQSQSLCIIQEYACGGDLQGLIHHCQTLNRVLDEDLIWRFSAQMISGLKTLHDMKILHRDLKSSNIFIGKD